MDHENERHDRPPRSDGWAFLREAAGDLRTTGAVAPSGRGLAHALSESACAPVHGPATVLEAGAGTGVVTSALLSRLPRGSRLDVVEANPRFADRLQRLADRHRQDGKEVRLHLRPVEEVETDRTYDAVVSGLPFANFAPRHVATVMERYLELLRPGGTLTYFAYLGTLPASALFASRSRTRRHRAVEEVLAGYRRSYATGCRTVWTNLPPARVRQLRRPVPAATAPTPRREAAAIG